MPDPLIAGRSSQIWCRIKPVTRLIPSSLLDVFEHRTAAPNSEWSLSPAELRDVGIRWPIKYEWDAASDWVEFLKVGSKRYVRLKLVDDIAQPYKGTVVFEIVISGRPRRVAVGYSDYLPIDEDCVRQCDLYFKMQYDANGYSAPNVVPGGYVADGKRLYRRLNKLRKLRGQRIYRNDVSGRFGLAYAREIREKATGMLIAQDRFGFEGGMNPIAYSEFLEEIARSRICIDLPGLGPFCFRLINYLAIGSCIIAYPHSALMHIPLVDRTHIVYCKPDMSDLVDLCEYYLAHDDEREQIALNARQFFDRYLHKDNLVRYYLRTCLDRLR